MLKTRNVFDWIGRRKEQDVLKHVLEHLDEVCDVVLDAQKAIEAFAARDSAAVKELIKKIATKEHEADLMRRKMMTELAEGTFLPADREDLMHLAKRQDNIADFAHSVGRTLALFDDFLPEELAKGLVDFIAIDVKAINRLKDAVNCLIEKECDKVLEICNEIETLEEEADDHKREMLRVALRSKLDAPLLLMSRDLIEAIEEIADRVEDTADEIRILAVELK